MSAHGWGLELWKWLGLDRFWEVCCMVKARRAVIARSRAVGHPSAARARIIQAGR
jgi:hypothetical protein